MENHKRKKEKICPLCGKTYCKAPAQSRRDKSRICPDCGLKEAMEDIGMNDAQKDEIMNLIRNHTGAGKGIKDGRK